MRTSLDPTRSMVAALVIGALAVAVVLVSACTGRPTVSPERRMVRTVMGADPSSLSLIGNTDRNSDVVAMLVTDSLVRYDTSLTPKPRLARSWSLSPDGLTWTFELREGVRWHDGTPVTARDVVFTARKVQDPATQSRSYASAFENLVSIEAPNDRTVRATYRLPFPDALDSWTLPIVPEHLASKKDESFLTGSFSRKPVGCGPFRFVRAEPGREIVLEANADYWDGRPSIDGISFRILPDPRTAYEALLQGDLDLLGLTPDLWRESLSEPRAKRLSRFVYYRLDAWLIGWNQDGTNPFFGDPRVRRAMVLALDRAQFSARALEGLARLGVGTIHPDSPWYNRALQPWPYDPAEAGRLLSEAGWLDRNGDGVRDRDDVPFSFTMLLPATSQEIAGRMAEWVQDSLGKVGVRMTIEKLEWRTFQERRRAHAFQAAMAALSFSPTPDQSELYHASAREHGMNYGGFHDDEVDRLLEEGRQAFDPAARRAVYDRIQQRLHELEPLSCLFYFAAPMLHDPDLEGIEKSLLGLWYPTPGARQWRWAGEPRRR